MDRFDLEDAIYELSRSSEDIRTITKCNNSTEALLGLAALVDARSEKLIDAYSRYFKLDQYCTDPEALRRRGEYLG